VKRDVEVVGRDLHAFGVLEAEIDPQASRLGRGGQGNLDHAEVGDVSALQSRHLVHRAGLSLDRGLEHTACE